MKKWGILIGGLILGVVFGAQAQTDMSAVFSSSNKNIIYANQAKQYTGSPLVFIEGISDKPQPKDWIDNMKIKLFGSMEIPKTEAQKPLPPLEQNNIQKGVKINSLFGGEKTVAFIPHTSDWNFIIQVLNDEDIIIQEDIQFIKTKDIDLPIRDWPKQDLNMLEVQVNSNPILSELYEEKGTLKLKLPELESGVHRVHLSYLIKRSGIFSKKQANIRLPLIGTGWNLPVDSFTGVILFPKQIKESKATFLFGKNKQDIPEAVEIIKDNSGALFFKATHLLPASSSIQLNLNLEFDSFVQKGIFDKLSKTPSFLIFLISLGVILGYLILNVIEIKITPIEEVAIRKKIYVSSNSLKSFIHRTKEIWCGLFLLWMGTFITLKIMKASLEFFEIQLLFLFPVVFVLIMDYLLLYPRQEKIKKIKGIE